MKPLEAALTLSLADGVGPVAFRKLINAFGSAEAALTAPEARMAEIEGLGPETARRIASSRRKAADAARKELAIAARHGVRIVSLEDEACPAALRYMHDPPPVLYVKGELLERDRLAVAIVGSRHCTYYGRSQAETLAGALAMSGFTVVSGLARGIDSAAHQGALDAEGRTIAVLGNGLASVYPPENSALAERGVASGALVSEFPMTTPPAAENFPRRNRVISALSLGVVVVEGTEKSGALITARHAREQGREIFAVPGKVDNPAARGPHRLIRDGAKLVADASDIIEELGPVADGLLPEPRKPAAGARDEKQARQGQEGAGEQARAPAAAFAPPGGAATLGRNRQERRIYELLSTDPKQIDQIIVESGLPPQEVSSTLMILEIKRACRKLAGDTFVRAK